MRIGFKVQLKPYEMFEIQSNEYETIDECLNEIYYSLLRVDHPAVREFREGSIFRDVRCYDRFESLSARGKAYAVLHAEKWEKEQQREQEQKE